MHTSSLDKCFLLSCTQHFQQMSPVMFPAQANLPWLPVVHTAHILSLTKGPPHAHSISNQMFPCHAHNTCVPDTTPSGAHRKFKPKCLTYHAYTNSISRKHFPCYAYSISSKCFPWHVFGTCVTYTATSSAHSIFQQMFSLSCIHQVLLKDPSWHAYSISNKCLPVLYTALVWLTLLPVGHTAPPNKCSASHAYIKSCPRTPPGMHTAFLTNVCLSCIQHLCA